MAGIKIWHETARSCVWLVPDMKHPRDEPVECNTCNMWHLVKTYHLWLDDTGSAIVSKEVLEGLKQAGFPKLQVVHEVKEPPTLAFGKDFTREKVDQGNRKSRFVRKRWK
jgi:hypothetical protein